MRGAATAGAGAVTLRALDPAQEGGAIAVSGTAIAVGATVAVASAAAGAIAGAYMTNKGKKIEHDFDPDDVNEDKIYAGASAVADERGGPTGTRTAVEKRYVEPAENESDYANSAWSQIRVDAATEIYEGNGQTAALQAAQDAHDLQTLHSFTSIVEGWNQVHLTMVPHYVLNYEESVGAISIGSNWNPRTKSNMIADGSSDATAEPVEASEVSSGGYLLWRVTLADSQLPTAMSNTEREEPLSIIIPSIERNGNQLLYMPMSGGMFESACNALASNRSGVNGDGGASANTWTVTHSTLDSKTFLDGLLYAEAENQIRSEYTYIQNNLDTYVTELANGLNQGEIEVETILGPQDLMDEYASNDKQSRLAQEMLATGIGMPTDDLGFRALISHPELATNELWVDLYPRLENGSVSIDGPTTLAAENYSMAVIGYQSKANDEYIVEALPGTDPLEVLEVETTNSQSVEQDRTVSSDSSVVVSESGVPDAIPDDADLSNWSVTLTTDSGSTDTVAYPDLTKDGETITAPSTSLSSDSTVTEAQWTPSVTYDTPTQSVTDPANYDPQNAQKRIEQTRELNNEIDRLLNQVEDHNEQAGGGIFAGSNNLPTIGGFGVLGTIVAAGGGLFAFDKLTSN